MVKKGKIDRKTAYKITAVLVFGLFAIVMLAVKAHMEADRRLEDEIRFKQ